MSENWSHCLSAPPRKGSRASGAAALPAALAAALAALVAASAFWNRVIGLKPNLLSTMMTKTIPQNSRMAVLTIWM